MHSFNLLKTFKTVKHGKAGTVVVKLPAKCWKVQSLSHPLPSCLSSDTTTNIFHYVWHLLAQANEPSRTHIKGNQPKFKSQWGSYEENQTAVLSSVGLTRGKPASTQLLTRAQKKPISPDLLWEWSLDWQDGKDGMGQNITLYFFIEEERKKSSLVNLLNELHLTHLRFNNLPLSQCITCVW